MNKSIIISSTLAIIILLTGIFCFSKDYQIPTKYQALFDSEEYKTSSLGVLKLEETKWSTENINSLNAFFRKTENNAKKTAVFDCDKTIINGDITEGAKKGDRDIDGVFKYLIKNKKLLTVNYEKDIFKLYEDLCEVDMEKGYKFPSELLKGLKQQDVIEWANEVWKSEYSELIYPESKAVIKRLVENGFEVYIISASPMEFVRPISKYIGVPEQNIYGISQEVKDGILTGKVLDPVPYGEGKVRVIKEIFKIKPIYGQGDGIINDTPMLKYSIQNGGIGVFINPKNDKVKEEAIDYNFIIQYNPFWDEYIKNKK